MNKQDVFNAWAPSAATWSAWAKPVLFSQMNDIVSQPPTEAAANNFSGDLSWAVDSTRSTAIVVDLPGAQGLAVGLCLAAVGYRPVPLYNACPEPQGDVAVVDVRPIMSAVADGAALLRELNLLPESPPAFLLDANRNSGEPVPGKFDNRSISLPTDFPSSNLLQSHGIQRVVVIQSGQTAPRIDLSHTLRRWQEAGLTILAFETQQSAVPQLIVVERPKAFRVLWYNLLAKLGLKQSPLGGFGGRLPMPSVG